MSASTAATSGTTPSAGSRSSLFGVLQRIGRSLMLPIAVLPAAALLLRLGQPDLLGADGLGAVRVAEVVGKAGDARALGISAGDPVLSLVRRSFAGGRAVEYVDSRYRCDRYLLRTPLAVRPPPTGPSP